MSAYLDRLKQLEDGNNFHYAPNSEPSKPSKVPFEPFEGTHPAHIEKKIIDEGDSQNIANPEPSKPSKANAVILTGDLEAISAWLTFIGEHDPACIGEVMDACRADPDALAYYLGRSVEATAHAHPAGDVTTSPDTREGRTAHPDRRTA